MESRSFIQAVLSKLQEKLPLKYTFANKLSCLNTKGMATESSEGNITTFRAFVRHLNEANRVTEGMQIQSYHSIRGGGGGSS